MRGVLITIQVNSEVVLREGKSGELEGRRWAQDTVKIGRASCRERV